MRDLTARALIRDEALALFAQVGPDAVSVRQIASAAGVSPGLVIHHFGSKDGLRRAVDDHVAGLLDAVFADLERDGRAAASVSSAAELLLRAFPPGSPVPDYLRRLWLTADPVGTRVFARWYQAGRAVLERWTDGGIVRPAADPAALAAFLLVNDLALLLLREQVRAVLGTDPLSAEGMTRWAAQALAVYRDGLFAAEEAQ